MCLLFSKLFDLDAMISSSNMQLSLDKIKEITYANVRFLSINGDKENAEVVNNFEKISLFFLSDFKWTKYTYDNMCSHTQKDGGMQVKV